VQEAGLNVCCGGIIGMGESRAQRAGLIAQLASLPVPPQSVPINHLVPIAGTPLQDVRRWTSSNSCAPWRWPASPCRMR
jgi:biotin synthase